jgi:hypothetical protein
LIYFAPRALARGDLYAEENNDAFIKYCLNTIVGTISERHFFDSMGIQRTLGKILSFNGAQDHRWKAYRNQVLHLCH